MAKGDDIQERLIDFAVRVLKLCNSLPTNFAGQHIARQLIRSGTAPAAHYAEHEARKVIETLSTNSKFA